MAREIRMIQYNLIKISPRLLRIFRSKLLVDWGHLLTYLPRSGKLLDVGCGIGVIGHEIALSNPNLEILGIDVSAESIRVANKYHSLPNEDYRCQNLEEVEEKFQCILFLDVFHHVDPSQYPKILELCKERLKPDGYIVVKDIEREGGTLGWWMDRYISGCKELYPQSRDEMTHLISSQLQIVKSELKYRFPFPHYYIKATL